MSAAPFHKLAAVSMRHDHLPTFHIRGISRWQMAYFARLADLHQFFHPAGEEPVLPDLVGYAYRNFDLYTSREQVMASQEQERQLLKQVLERVSLEKTHAIYVLHSKDHQDVGCCCLIKRRWEDEVFRLLEEFDLKREWVRS
ncbi:hypothetical protein [Deinococcus cellulosilyticus]|uniref:Uncharacterized protein n=1 Tax=Deinococcus cellulosilyticus (strain DSM 18568 / NBRC 106333 / KACC 11606 / 5516J-15) TaxID=1223518 RepID=A0A511N8W2_DEIC1|nr:hypothetical protein [Deinococcus cellulosilyticus]GEM49279.1 hypothetical protein DC3_49140 [Deinococcus cellulosilyticus NBRC 106333 = KACC 11606]